MKKTITFFILLITGLIDFRAQVVLHENFNAPFNPATNGWEIVNLSSTTGTNVNGWYQGNSTQFSAILGGQFDYYAADMNATSSAGTTNTISCWLISPTLNLQNGAWIQFATMSNKLQLNKPDRLQVYYSIGTGTNVGTSAGTATNSAGTFTNLILDINTNMATNYPGIWSLVTNTLNGIGTPTVGRIAFRYYIPNGGAAGPNGNNIAIDEFRYSLPCNRPVFFGDPVTGAAVCVGAQVPFMIYQTSSSNPVNSYTWSNGATTPTTYIVPTNTGVTAHATLGESTPGCQGLDISFYYALPSPTVTYSLNPGNQICAGQSVTVTAGGASTYSYLLGQQSSTVNPIVLTAHSVTSSAVSQFTLAGKASNGCVSIRTVTLQTNPLPIITASATKSMICLNGTVGLAVSGAASYSWSGPATTTMSGFTYTGASVGAKQFVVYGISALGCQSPVSLVTVNVSACTGLGENEGFSGVQIYPNPMQNELQVSGFNGDIQLYDVSGKLLRQEFVGESIRLSTEDLPGGLYFLHLKSSSGPETIYKVIKP